MDPQYSIHILNHNYHPVHILESLVDQINQNSASIQLTIWDDGSESPFADGIRALKKQFPQDFVKWRLEAENRGRAVMRQKILDQSTGGWMVSLDSDMAVDDDFIAKMIGWLSNPATVYCGQHYYQSQPPARPYLLHWNYGKQREVPGRDHDHYMHFTTGIYAWHGSLANDLSFNPELTGYGHEDTLFGQLLKQKGIPVRTAPMRALHLGLNTHDDFIQRQLSAVRNLHMVVSLYPEYKNRLIAAAQTIRRIPFMAALVSAAPVRRLCLRRLQRHPQKLRYLDLLKLNEWLGIRD